MTTRSRRLPPLVMRWQEPHDPLPVRVIRGPRQSRLTAWFERHSADSGPAQQPFDFCTRLRELLTDITQRCPDFRSIDVPRILVTATQARGLAAHGLQARVTPLRFAGGALTRLRRGIPFGLQRYFLGDHEYLYLMTFCLPRYLDQDFDQKMVTLFHELYHISPAFDGDLRRHAGRCQFHTHSQRRYDEGMVHHARDYLSTRPDPRLHGFLRMNFAQLQERHGAVTAIIVPRPKIIPLAAASLQQAAGSLHEARHD